jgi:hypothetical protein
MNKTRWPDTYSWHSTLNLAQNSKLGSLSRHSTRIFRMFLQAKFLASRNSRLDNNYYALVNNSSMCVVCVLLDPWSNRWSLIADISLVSEFLCGRQNSHTCHLILSGNIAWSLNCNSRVCYSWIKLRLSENKLQCRAALNYMNIMSFLK